MAGSSKKSSKTVANMMNAVTKRMNASALTRRPLSRYRPSALDIRKRSGNVDSSMDYDYEDDSPDYDPNISESEPDTTSFDINDLDRLTYRRRRRVSKKREPLANRNISPPSMMTTRSKKRKLDESPEAKMSMLSLSKLPKTSTSTTDKSVTPRKFRRLRTPSRSPSPVRNLKSSESTSTVSSSTQTQKLVTAPEKPTVVEENAWGSKLPLDILHMIFRFAIKSESPVPFLIKIQKVCRLWNYAATFPRAWSKVDLEFMNINAYQNPHLAFGHLAKYASGIQELSVTRWTKLQIGQIEEFLKLTKDVRVLNVSFCQKLDLRRLLCIVVPEYCSKLISLDLSYIDPTGNKRITSVLRAFLSLESGRRLERLYLNGNALADLRLLCAESALSGVTQNIRVLDLSRVCSDRRNSSKIRLIDFVRAFPNLRVLHMVDAMLDFICKPEEEVELEDGWLYLHDCDISASSNVGSYRELYDIFIRLLARCKNLRRLNLSGLSIYDRLVWLREMPLTDLNMSRIRDLAPNAVTIDFFSTWGQSLESLSIAWVIGYVDSLCALFAKAKKCGLTPRLKRLDLMGTCVTAKQLRVLLDVCESLEYVDVQSCRGMPLGMKRAFDGVDEVKALREKLSQHDGNY